MNWKSHFGMAAAMLAAWFALGVFTTAYADDTFDGSTLDSQLQMSGGDSLDPSEWEYSFSITLGSEMKTALGSGTESGFPILVRLSPSIISGFDYGNFSDPDGKDLIFVDSKNNFLEYEVDTWNTSGTSLVWVKVPTLAADAKITCRYGGPAYSHDPKKVWSGYVGVWHMNEASGNAVDATGHGLDGVPTGFNTALMIGETTAPTGRGRINQTASGSSTKSSNRLRVPSYNNFITDHAKFTLSGWFKSTDKTGYPRPLSRKNNYSDDTGWEIQYNNNSPTSVSARGSDGSGEVKMEGPDSTAGWYSLAFVFNGTTETSYGNGGETSLSGTIVAVKTRTDPMAIGNNSGGTERGWCGMYDEIRLYDGVCSAAWVKLDYLVVKNADALVFGSVVKPDPELPKLKDCDAVVNTNGNIIVSGLVQTHAASVTVTLTAEGQKPVVFTFDEPVAADSVFKREFGEDDGLVKFATYTVSVTAENPDDPTKAASKTVEKTVKYGKVAISDFDYRFDVTVPDGFTASPLTNFPLLVRISESIPGFAYTQFKQAGEDLLAFDMDGNVLPCELENFDPSGVSRLWVEVPVVTNGTRIAVCYGVGESVPKEKMWNEYASVLHLNSLEVPDATGNAVPVVNSLAECVGGKLGNGCSMGTTSGKNGAVVTVPISAKLDKCNGVFTASAWTKLNAAPAWGYLMSRKEIDSTPAWGIQFRGNSGGTGAADGLAFSTAGKSDTESVLFKPLTCFTTGSWVKWTAVFNGTELSLYFNGVKFATKTTAYGAAVNGTLPLAVGGFVTALNPATLPAVTDEARVKIGAVGDDWVAAEYCQETDELPLEYGEVGPADPNAPVLETPQIVANDDGTFSVTVTITGNMPKEGSVKLDYNDTVTVLTTTDVSVPAQYHHTLTPAAEDVTDLFVVSAKSTLGGTRRCTTYFYSGALKIVKIRDASEKGFTNGIWRVSRADTAYALDVALEKLDTSTAEVGVDYVDFPQSATIPAGTNSVDILLTPLMNLAREEDSWVDLALSNGAYRVGASAAQARVVIQSYTPPVGGMIWCATAPGKASVASNWTTGEVPSEFSTVMFDGDVSTADCEWDIDATHKVAGWTQTANYTGTVTLDTTFDDSFPKLVVSGDMMLGGGKIAHRLHDASHKVDVYRLSLDIGGMLMVGKDAAITARGLGSYGPRSEGESCYGGGYNGKSAWGSLTEPNAVGSSANDNGTYKCRGGGAVWIEVAGLASVSGQINANGIKESGAWDTHAGSGGSVYLKCAKLSGPGKITANCENTLRGSNSRSGAGGRISVLLTAGELDGFAYTQFDARAGWVSYSNHGGTGTVLVRSPEKPNGILYLRDSADKYGTYGYRVTSLAGYLTDIPAGEEWTLDGIMFGQNAVLRVPKGTLLSLPNGLDSVSSDATDINCGIIVDGGQFLLPEQNQVMSGKWTLTTRNEEPVIEVAGNLTLKNGANIGSIMLNDSRVDSGTTLPLYGKCLLKVTGDLTVQGDATLIARQCGLQKDKNTRSSGGFKGVLNAHVHGGRAFYNKGIDSQERMYTSYDSVFAPYLPGNSAAAPSGQYTKSCGGVISLDVGGTLFMYGKANVSGDPDTMTTDQNGSGGTGGSIDITAGWLTGSGSFLAEGGGYSNLSGPGGRIAIKLTGEGADFDSFKGKISASGRLNGTPARSTSSGTIYLQTGDDLDKAGTLRIAMSAGNRSTSNPSSTELLSRGFGGDTLLDYQRLGVELRDFGFGAVNVDLKMSWLKFVDGDSRLDLEGHTLTVGRAWYCGSKVSVGSYVAGSEPFGTLLTDSVGGGRLEVTGYGLWVFIQ